MRMRAHATGQYINEGFGMFVGLRESRYLQLPQDFIAPHNLRGYCLSDIHLLNLLICRLAVGSCGTIAVIKKQRSINALADSFSNAFYYSYIPIFILTNFAKKCECFRIQK